MLMLPIYRNLYIVGLLNDWNIMMMRMHENNSSINDKLKTFALKFST